MDGLVPLEGVPAAEVLATRGAFVLLVGVVDALVSFEMLALPWVEMLAFIFDVSDETAHTRPKDLLQ